MMTPIYDTIKRQLLTKGIPVRTQFLKIAGIEKNTAACCFAVSCFVGCCCCKPGHACLDTMDMGNYWKQALETAYHDVEDKRINLLFMKAMRILPNIYATCQEYVQTVNDRMNQARLDQNHSQYTVYSLQARLAQQTFDERSWLKSFFNMLYDHMPYHTYKIQQGVQYVNIDDKIIVDIDDYRTLVAAMPMFFKECQAYDHIRTIHDGVVMDKIRHEVMTIPV